MGNQSPDLGHHIDRIYQAAVAPEHWPIFLDGLRKELRLASLSFVFRHPSEGDRGLITSVGADEHYGDLYRSHFYKVNPWLPWGPAIKVGRAVLADSVLPQSELVRTEFYNDWLRPQGLAHLFTAFISKLGPRGLLSELGGLREKAAGPLSDEDLHPVRLLIPHLQRALVIHSRVEEAELSFTVTVDAEPHEAGIDPFNKLIDREPDDNLVRVDKDLARS